MRWYFNRLFVGVSRLYGLVRIAFWIIRNTFGDKLTRYSDWSYSLEEFEQQ